MFLSYLEMEFYDLGLGRTTHLKSLPISRTLSLSLLPHNLSFSVSLPLLRTHTDELQNHPKSIPTTELRPPSNSWRLHDHVDTNFRTIQAHSELSEVPRKLGVLRWKFLDVRTRRSTSSKFGRSFRGIFRRIPGELGVELYSFEKYPVSGDLRGFRGSFRPNHGELGVVQGADRHDALAYCAREL
ncbi:uncharacterized protein LOC126585628 isoform X3 [Malus sylvestris]|uniref:uncharacterized protein LOC126585628 isoform X2 n=1 Tax=Malus sylvestris TaxID=3752 RepID=UPI0021ACCB83|nr:uncharacterized protein LOC126585628 isoform X2 [Malus sylvestris]XP_050106050.1 uncharacterized protein LOC126585628 isoform X3 [Malus sylvestris]